MTLGRRAGGSIRRSANFSPPTRHLAGDMRERLSSATCGRGNGAGTPMLRSSGLLLRITKTTPSPRLLWTCREGIDEAEARRDQTTASIVDALGRTGGCS